jgi:hypothetical protein
VKCYGVSTTGSKPACRPFRAHFEVESVRVLHFHGNEIVERALEVHRSADCHIFNIGRRSARAIRQHDLVSACLPCRLTEECGVLFAPESRVVHPYQEVHASVAAVSL